MAQPKVFVSHSSNDSAFAEQLVKDLNAVGADAWLDKEQLGAGNFQQRISEALARCEWFVLVMTRNALDSKWVRQEVDAANILHHEGTIKDLIFVQAGPVEFQAIPSLWRVYNILDGVQDRQSALDRILAAIGLEQPAWPLPSPATETTPSPSTKAVELRSVYRIEEADRIPCPQCRKSNDLRQELSEKVLTQVSVFKILVFGMKKTNVWHVCHGCGRGFTTTFEYKP